MMSGTPVLVLREGATREEGKDAQHENIAAATAISKTLRTTLGPRGMDKMLVNASGTVTITNDGATIVREMSVQHPAAKMVVEVAKTQDQECGDGTKTSVILTGTFLHKAEELLEDHVHSTRIASGYRIANAKALESLDRMATEVTEKDSEILKRVAMTSMISKGVSADREHLAEITVRAVLSVLQRTQGKVICDRGEIQLVKRQGGNVRDSQVIDGLILEQAPTHPAMPTEVQGARIALLDVPMQTKRTEFGSEIRVEDPTKLSAFVAEEEKILQETVGALQRAGVTVVLSQSVIDNLAAHFLAKIGIYAISNISHKEVERISKATGARLVTRIADVTAADLGSAKNVTKTKVGDTYLTFVTGCNHARSVSLLVRGGTEHVTDEVARSLDDAIATVGSSLEDGKVITGAGAAFAEVSQQLRGFAPSVGGREQLAVEAFASALEEIPLTLAENAGMDRIDTLIELRKEHASGRAQVGVDVLNGTIGDMSQTAVEPLRVARQALASATDAAAMILRIDDVIKTGAPAAEASSGMPSKNLGEGSMYG